MRVEKVRMQRCDSNENSIEPISKWPRLPVVVFKPTQYEASDV